jgi:hypothetical protein
VTFEREMDKVKGARLSTLLPPSSLSSTRRSAASISRYRFLLTNFLALMIITYVPAISMALIGQLMSSLRAGPRPSRARFDQNARS